VVIEQASSELEDAEPEVLVKYMTEGRIGYISLSNKMQLSTATVVAEERSIMLTVTRRAFERNLLKLEMAEQNQLL
jgi:hypothetical protein